MAGARRDCIGWEVFLSTGCLLLHVLLFQPASGKVCNDRTRHAQDNSWFTKDKEKLPIMVLMPMNESTPMSSISQGIEPAVELAIQHIQESEKYSFTLITKIYDTEVNTELFQKLWLFCGVYVFLCACVCVCVWRACARAWVRGCRPVCVRSRARHMRMLVRLRRRIALGSAALGARPCEKHGILSCWVTS